jgi:hypothetical protein
LGGEVGGLFVEGVWRGWRHNTKVGFKLKEISGKYKRQRGEMLNPLRSRRLISLNHYCLFVLSGGANV